MPTYIIENELAACRVVEARTPASARQHVARDLTVRKITTRECFELSAAGLELETAGEGGTASDPNEPGLPM